VVDRAGDGLPEREALHRRRFDQLICAGRELCHALNNALTLPVGAFELLAARPDLPDDARELLRAASEDLDLAERHIRTFHQIVDSETARSHVRRRPTSTVEPGGHTKSTLPSGGR
jgi:hypothetical protein